jgi:hypothetical protein
MFFLIFSGRYPAKTIQPELEYNTLKLFKKNQVPSVYRSNPGTIRKKQKTDARDGIRTQELLRDQALNLTPLTWLGYPRACIHYV